MTDKIVVLTTCAHADEAEKIARHLVEKRLAACVSLLPGARSVYRWRGTVETASEWLLIIKSRGDLAAALTAEIQALHSYEVPEVLALPVADGSEKYLSWMEQEVVPRG